SRRRLRPGNPGAGRSTQGELIRTRSAENPRIGSLQTRPLQNADVAGLAFEVPGKECCRCFRVAARECLTHLDDAAVFHRDTRLALLKSEVRVVLDAHGETLLLLCLKETTRSRPNLLNDGFRRRHSRRIALNKLSTRGQSSHPATWVSISQL